MYSKDVSEQNFLAEVIENSKTHSGKTGGGISGEILSCENQR
jgi:hypothetical protein